MPLKALLLANAAMALFALAVVMHSYNGLNAGDLVARMEQAGMMETGAES